MSDDDRTVKAEIEVPGTPEEVWQAIATGPGISAWFVPTEIDGREGGTVTQYHGPGHGMQQTARVTAFEPPSRLAWENEAFSPEEGLEARPIAVEFLVEARGGGTCVVRVVNSGFGDGEEWDQAVRGTAAGWPTVLENLRLVLTHFAGQEPASIVAGGQTTGSRDEAWASVLGALGLEEGGPGDRVAVRAEGAPEFAGVVQRSAGHQMIVLLDAPCPGLGYVGSGGPGTQPFVFLRAQLFGDRAAQLAERDGPPWRAWMHERFPAQAGRGAADR